MSHKNTNSLLTNTHFDGAFVNSIDNNKMFLCPNYRPKTRRFYLLVNFIIINKNDYSLTLCITINIFPFQAVFICQISFKPSPFEYNANKMVLNKRKCKEKNI